MQMSASTSQKLDAEIASASGKPRTDRFEVLRIAVHIGHQAPHVDTFGVVDRAVGVLHGHAARAAATRISAAAEPTLPKPCTMKRAPASGRL